MFEHIILPAVTLLGLCAIVLYGMYTERQDIGKRARAKALDEAREALQSVADTAKKVGHMYGDEGRLHAARDTNVRAYYYDRAASIVRSIPLDRL